MGEVVSDRLQSMDAANGWERPGADDTQRLVRGPLLGWTVIQRGTRPCWEHGALEPFQRLITDGRGTYARAIEKDGRLTLRSRAGVVRRWNGPTVRWNESIARVGDMLLLMRDDVLEPIVEPRVIAGCVVGFDLECLREAWLEKPAAVISGAPGIGKRTMVEDLATALGGHRVSVEGERIARMSAADAHTELLRAIDRARGGVLEVRNLDAIERLSRYPVSSVAKRITDNLRSEWRGVLSTSSTVIALTDGHWYGAEWRLPSLEERADEMPLIVAGILRRIHPLLVASVDAVEFCIAVAPWKDNFIGLHKALESAADRALRRKSHVVDIGDVHVEFAPEGAEDLVTGNDE